MSTPINSHINPYRFTHSVDSPQRAKTLATELAADADHALDKLESTQRSEAVQAVAKLSSRFEAKGLGERQLGSALMVAGALVGGVAGQLTALMGDDVAEALVDRSIKLLQGEQGEKLQQLGEELRGVASSDLAVVAAGGLQGERSNPKFGIKCGSFLRPDPFFAYKTKAVLCTEVGENNPNGLQQFEHKGKHWVSLDHLFENKNEVVIAFGKPNVYTVIPREDGKGYEKLDAFMYFRKAAKRTNVDRVQSGVLLRARNLPPEAATTLREAMDTVAGHTSISCARANAKALTRAGFTSGGKSLAGQLFPFRLFKRIAEHGLEYQGKKVEFDLINTTDTTIEDHFASVIMKELSSPVRTIEKMLGKDEAPGDIKDLAKKVRETEKAARQAPKLSESEDGPPVRLRNSRPGLLAAAIRRYWGAHVLFEALPNPKQTNVDDFLPKTLVDKYSKDEKMGMVDKLKSLAFSKPAVNAMRGALGATFDETGAYTPNELARMLQVGEEGKPAVFNFIITGNKEENRISVTRIDVDKKVPDWVLSKHLMLSNYSDDVRMAGEMWAETYTKDDGSKGIRVHINNNSGTYRPSAEQTHAAARYLESVFPGVEVVAEPVDPPKPKAKKDYQKHFVIDAAGAESVRGLEGKTLTLTDATGKMRTYQVKHYKTITLDTEYLDTADHKLLDARAELRARTRTDNGKLKDIEVEAKIPVEPGSELRARVKGAEFDDPAAWQAQRAQMMAPDSDDKAVSLAQTITGKDPLATVAHKNVVRELFLLTPKFPPLLGSVIPQFVMSLDTITANRPGEAPTDSWHAVEPQIFTKLPWTKKVTEERIAQFEDLSSQLSSQLGVQESQQTTYAETMEHLGEARS